MIFRRILFTFFFTLVSLLSLVSAQEPSKQQVAKTNIKPESKPPAIIVISAEDSKALKDLNREAENADLRQQLLTERIRAAQVELERLQQTSKDAIDRVRLAIRAACKCILEDYDLSEEKGQFVLKLKTTKQ